MRISKALFILFCIFIVASCSGKKGKNGEEADSVEVMYNKAISKLEKGRYDASVEIFEEVERTYPYSKWATKSQIMSAYANYKDEKYDDALITLERFTKLHPGNSDIGYAYYLRALSFYEQISDVTKDQSYSQYAKPALHEVMVRFPHSKYAIDAKLKIDLVNDHLAGKEVDVGRFYLRRGNYVGAINRFQKVVKEYDTTAHVPEALHRLVEAYYSLGVVGEARKYAAILGYNFVDSKWYKRSYKILEGKNFAKLEEARKGKWYNFANWQGRIFKKSKASGGKDKSEELVNDLDNAAKNAKTPEFKKKASGELVGDEGEQSKGGGRWFKLPFSGN